MNSSSVSGTPRRALLRIRLAFLLLAFLFTLLAPTTAKDARAAGFFVTPTTSPAGTPIHFEAAMAGQVGSDGLPVEGSERALTIRVNSDTRPGKNGAPCSGQRFIHFLSNAFVGWGQDIDITGFDAGWQFVGNTSICNPTNALPPGDYKISLDWQRFNADLSTTLGTPIDVYITVEPPIAFDVTPVEVLSGGTTRVTVDTSGTAALGTYASTITSFQLSGPCPGTLAPASGSTSWGIDYSFEIPSTLLPTSCGNLGLGGTYTLTLNYLMRYPSGIAPSVPPLVKQFRVKPINFHPFDSGGWIFAVTDFVPDGPYGEPIISATVDCPSGETAAATANGVALVNGQSPAPKWPGPNFIGDCGLDETGTYTLTVRSAHQTHAKTFESIGYEDSDGDGVFDYLDNCPSTPNADQKDTNGNGRGDLCDPDGDFDGVPDLEDNCSNAANPGQEDLDVDGAGDVCDADDEGDGLLDINDRCPRFYDPTNVDRDGDGFGDPCDPFPDDFDNDGINDFYDNCPNTFNPAQQDGDGDGLGTACDPNLSDGPGGDPDGDGLINSAETTLGTSPLVFTAFSPGINTYTGGQPTGTSNPATVGQNIGVAVAGGPQVDSVLVTVTDPTGKTVYHATLIPQSPVAFSFKPDIPGSWAVTAKLFNGSQLDSTYTLPLVVVANFPTGNKDQCKNDGWQRLYRADGTAFKNQGACVSYANTGR